MPRTHRAASPNRSSYQPLLDPTMSSTDDTKRGDQALEFEDVGATMLPEYRVYKRRFLGLGVLMLLNIIVSWCWLTYAPVSRYTMEYFNLDSESPVNWLSTVILCAYCVSTP
jgi:hypothetical protein